MQISSALCDITRPTNFVYNYIPQPHHSLPKTSLSVLLDFCRVSSPRTPSNCVTHHIETTGPPVSARTRRLGPDRLYAACLECWNSSSNTPSCSSGLALNSHIGTPVPDFTIEVMQTRPFYAHAQPTRPFWVAKARGWQGCRLWNAVFSQWHPT